MDSQDWKEISAKAQEILYNSIPSEWRIPKHDLPPEDQKDVTDFPAKCGLLTKAELEITDSHATEIVKKIAAGEWKAEDVCRAFCKRAAVAQQVVSRVVLLCLLDANECCRSIA
jgi:amidase